MSPLNFDDIRARLASSHGSEYWRSLDELADTEEFRDFVRHEFPRDVETWLEPMSRRSFLKLMGASLAMAFFSGCRKPLEHILPYNKAPEGVIPGKPLYFASALPFQGYARGVLVETHMGRPTKIEGNPQHPDSLGATDIFSQAATLEFYDPDRSQTVVQNGLPHTWDSFFGSLKALIDRQKEKRGAGLRILTETVTSPSLGAQLHGIQRAFPELVWHQYEPVNRDNVHAGALLAFGKSLDVRYRFSDANVIVSIDSDFLTAVPGGLRYANDFSKRRRYERGKSEMNRLYVIESNPSITGSMADHRLPLGPAAIDTFARVLAAELGIKNISKSGVALGSENMVWLRAVAADLRKNRGSSIIVAGYAQPAVVHALVHAMNDALGNHGRTIEITAAAQVNPVDQLDSLETLVREMRAGGVELLLMFGGNPVYSAPSDFNFADALTNVPTRVHANIYEDETSAACHWHVPRAHALESWGDARAFDGTVSIVQPQIQPLYDGKTDGEILSLLFDANPRSGYDLVRDHWKQHAAHADFESFWKKSLNDGVVPNTASSPTSARMHGVSAWVPQIPLAESELEILFQPDPTIWDGRYTNNGWLQELPKPITKFTWGNAALVSPALAEIRGLDNGDVVRLEWQDRTVEAPIWIVPGHAERTVTVTFGYGRTHPGRVGAGLGFNAYALRTSEAMWSGPGLVLEKTGRRVSLASTQHHYSMEGRDLIRVATPDEMQKNESSPREKETLYNYSKPAASDDYAWGMAIDLNTCIGCSACTIACQAENNIPIVGKEQVERGREMHWIRVDRYHTGGLDNPKSYPQPVPCMHCEEAPCELVCPVGATSHSDEGLNQMVYNRCIGTRYCSNNCPYKVRRFNFLNYTEMIKGPLKMMENPDVTVRSRGVMEKCTYCVQRIQQAKIGAEKENRLVRDGEVVPACAQVCPSKAIVFGNLKDPTSAVVKQKSDGRDYGILTELGTRPRTTYQTRLHNPNPAINESSL